MAKATGTGASSCDVDFGNQSNIIPADPDYKYDPSSWPRTLEGGTTAGGRTYKIQFRFVADSLYTSASAAWVTLAIVQKVPPP